MTRKEANQEVFMTNSNLSEGLERLDVFSSDLNARALSILECLRGPHPSEAQNCPPTAGLIGTMDRIANTLTYLSDTLVSLETVMGVSRKVPGPPPCGVDQNGIRPLHVGQLGKMLGR